MAARFRRIRERRLLVCHVCPPIRLSECISAAPTGRIFVKFDTEDLH
jgi:hypothetical protein